MKMLRMLIWVTVVVLLPPCGLANAASLSAEVRPAAAPAAMQPLLVALNLHIGPQDAVLLIDPRGNEIVAINTDHLLIPASTLKILTALAGIRVLGTDFHFQTDFYLDAAGNLKVKGFGDPLLLSEILAEIAQALSLHLFAVNDLILDDSFFDLPERFPGAEASFEPYYAPPGALSANFNTINIVQNTDGGYVSAEAQTPLPAYAVPRIQGANAARPRIVFSHDRSENTLYTGHLLADFLKAAGVSVQGHIRMGTVDATQDNLLYRFRSPYPFTEVIGRLMEYSNNFMANQVFLTTAAYFSDPPASRSSAVQAHQQILADILNISPAGQLSDGSGLATDNRLTARHLARALEAFAPYRHLLRKSGSEYYKTGTLTDVRTRAGYFDVPDQGLYRFVVLVNTPGRGTEETMGILRQLAGVER